MIKPKLCPFCGGEVKVILCDEEGNHKLESYRENPWSGISFQLGHVLDPDRPCPIAHHKGEFLGAYLYDTEEEALESWNQRYEN